MDKKKLFGKGIYGSKDVPIKLLDGLILGIFAIVIILVVLFALNGGYEVSFDTDGGSEVASQTLNHGELVEEPEVPTKPGYKFEGWITSLDESMAETWDFGESKVEEEQTLYAVWTPDQITVKFDLNGGIYQGNDTIESIQVTYGETYGELPIPEKENATFGGWQYSGTIIKEDTTVSMTGEHILTAFWE